MSGEKEGNAPGIDDPKKADDIIVNNPEAVLKKNRELLGVNKNLKSELEEIKSKFDELENNRLASEGKKDDLLKKLQENLSEKEKALKTMQAKYAYNVVTNQVKTFAEKAGCLNADHLLKLGDLSTLEVDENFNVPQDGIKGFIESLQKEAPYLFKKDAPNINDKKPTANVTTKKPLDQMTKEEILEELKKLN